MKVKDVPLKRKEEVQIGEYAEDTDNFGFSVLTAATSENKGGVTCT